MNYNLEERTRKFSFSVIDFLARIKKNEINRSLISQLIRSATSVGANYREANGAVSKNDFRCKIHICKKEIQETKYWIELFSKSNPEEVEGLRILWKEAQELTLIFGKIAGKLK
jgi:four helix bundle protein